MSAGWVAGSVRGRLLTRRRLGATGARAVAAAGSEAVAQLAVSPYGRDVRPEMAMDTARRAIGSVCVWHLRVLAGWLPPRGGAVVRVFAGRFELENIGCRFASLAGETVPDPYALGALAVVSPRLAVISTAEEVRLALAGSAWGDPGTTDWALASRALETHWAGWLADAVPDGSEWAAGSAALVAARHIAENSQVMPSAAVVLRRLLGPGWESASDLAELVAVLPAVGRWVLEGMHTGEDLWSAEGRWWERVDRDAAATLRTGRTGPAAAAAAAARLVADARLAQAALEASAWGSTGMAAFDAVA